jgi:hypothetical protein
MCVYIYIYFWFPHGTEGQILTSQFLPHREFRAPELDQALPCTVYCNCCCLFQVSYDAVCIQFILSECPDTWNTTISVMSNVNARHYMNISLCTDETKQIPSLLTVQTLSQFPLSETPELASLFLALSTVEISTPLPRATVAGSQFQQDSSTDTFHLLFQCSLTNKRLNHEALPPPPTHSNLPPKNTTLTGCRCACDTWCVSLMSSLWPTEAFGKKCLELRDRDDQNNLQNRKMHVAVRWGKTARKWKPGRLSGM